MCQGRRRDRRCKQKMRMMEHQQGQAGNDGDELTRFLPEDVLAQVLGRLAPRDVAASRCVCAEWKAAVDGHRLLRADLLPLSVGGIFFNFFAHYSYAEFFRPNGPPGSASGEPSHLLDEYCGGWYAGKVKDHCNGLILLDSCVGNPATGWFAPLPPWPRPHNKSSLVRNEKAYVAFDPAVSPAHYSVLLINYDSLYGGDETEAAEWPPSPYLFHVFSSATGRWEERPFLRRRRQGEEAAVNVGANADVVGPKDKLLEAYRLQYGCFAVYWKQALYVHCPNNFFLRISLSGDDEYRVIKPPAGISRGSQIPFLGKSEKGPYLADSNNDPRHCFKVWILVDDESNRESHWVLRHCNQHLGIVLPRCYLDKKVRGPWILEDINYKQDYGLGETGMCKSREIGETVAAAPVLEQQFDEVEFTLDSTTPQDMTMDDGYFGDFSVFGFHPYKEVVFLGAGYDDRAVAYHLNSSKLQYLGNLRPTCLHLLYDMNEADKGVAEAFVYTPCKLDPHPPLLESD